MPFSGEMWYPYAVSDRSAEREGAPVSVTALLPTAIAHETLRCFA